MPTRGGLLLGVSAVATAGAGRLLGLRELFLLAAGGAMLLLLALTYVRGRRFRVAGDRQFSPVRVAAGATCRVELRLTNRGRRRSPVLAVEDGEQGRLLLGPLDPGEKVPAVYLLGTTRRGRLPVGPLRVRLQDPFGFAARAVTVLEPSSLTVHPSVERVELPPDPPGTAVVGAPRRATLSPQPAGEFFALRPYVEGDDLRLVHWPTSARLDTLVVRQEEAPRLRETTVALDLRRSVHHPLSLERAVSAAASVVSAGCSEDGLIRVVTTGGLDSGTGGGEGHLESVLDALATVDADGATDLRALAAAVGDEDGAALVLVTTGLASNEDLAVVGRLRLHCPLMVAVLFDADSGRPPSPLPAGSASFDMVVRVPPERRFGEVWSRSVAGVAVGR